VSLRFVEVSGDDRIRCATSTSATPPGFQRMSFGLGRWARPSISVGIDAKAGRAKWQPGGRAPQQGGVARPVSGDQPRLFRPIPLIVGVLNASGRLPTIHAGGGKQREEE